MHYERDPYQLEVYHEGKKRRLFVGLLTFNKKTKCYHFKYDMAYLHHPSAIPLGPELGVGKVEHVSEPHKMFPTFLDRIPSKENPAYKDYCLSQGISPDEQNPLVLLATIGRRGPSTFVFEEVFKEVGTIAEELKAFRKTLDLTQWDMAMMLELPELTILKVEQGTCTDKSITKYIHYFITIPELALAQLLVTGKKVHAKTRTRVYRYFKK